LSSTVVFLLFLPSESLVILLTSLLIGTPVISLFGALAGALSLGKSSILGPAIVLPLSLPILILGTSAVTSFLNGENPSFYFLMMLAIFIFLLPLICYACIGALRLHYE
jgi:heme exporter protein B